MVLLQIGPLAYAIKIINKFVDKSIETIVLWF